MKVVDLANEVYIEIGSPSSTSVPAIAFWIRGQLGHINNILFEDFVINEDYEIEDADGVEITQDAAAIIKKLYLVYDYQVQIRAQMNALASDSILSFREADGSSFTRTNRNEISKSLTTIRKDEIQMLNQLVNAYRVKTGTPVQVVGDDIVAGWYGGGFDNYDSTTRNQY